MAIIDNFRDILTIFTEYKISQKNADEILNNLKKFHHDHTQGCPGFISINLHLSLDKSKLISYSQWKNEDEYLQFIEKREIQSELKTIKGLEVSNILTKVAFTS